MQCPPAQTECVHLDITVAPTEPIPQPVIGPIIPPKLLAVMKKYKPNWRLNELSKPRIVRKKFQPKPFGYVVPLKIPPKLNDEKKFYADHMSKPPLRNLYINRNMYGGLSRGQRRKFDKNIDRTWDSIYNYYKKKERERKLRLQRQQVKKREKKRSIDQNIVNNLAKPKPVFKPEPIKKSSKIFSNFDRLDELATPKPSNLEPPKSLEVSPHALTYEPTEIVLRLAKPPARLLNLPQPLEPGKVKRSALRYKITPRIEEMAQPKQRHDKAKEDEDFDPWAISKNALKYKPTPRILELAKPVERD